jgi:DNA-binding beta-propeller fold protein YncE
MQEAPGMLVGTPFLSLGIDRTYPVSKLGRGLVSNRQSSAVTVFDLKTLKVSCEAKAGKKPDVILYEPATSRVFATAFHPDARLIFNSNGEGTITVIHQDGPDRYSVVETVKILPRAKTMALDLRTHQLFLSTAESGQFEALVVGR